MSHNHYVVEFPDGSRLYGVSNGSVLLRLLFNTPDEAMSFPREALYGAQEPTDAHLSAVEVITDPGEPWEEANRASYKEMWLTGPVNSYERLAEESHYDDGLYGGANFDV